MRRSWKFTLLLLIIVGTLCQCATFKKTSKRTKLLKKLSHVGRLHKASQPKSETGQKKNAMQGMMQPSHDQVAAMQNPEGLQASETEILNHLQNYNKHYLNNEMAAETALLADHGIDDDSALKISNMAALPNGISHHGAQIANAAIKAKIINSAKQDHEPTDQKQGSNSPPGGYDPNAYLYDANSWPEYSIHDSDYSNFHAVEMNNMNGENTDMPPMYNKPNMYDKPDESPEMDYQNIESEGGIEYPGDQKFPQGKSVGDAVNDEVKEAKEEALQNEQIEENNPPESSEDKPENTKAPASSEEVKPADSSEASGDSKTQGDTKPEAQNSQQKPENNPPAQIKDAASPKQQNGTQLQEAQQQQQQQQQQQTQQAKSTSSKLAASAVAQAAASLPPKAIASLVSRLVGGGKAVGATIGQGQGQIQKGAVGSSFQAPIPQDIDPAKEMTQSATQRLKVMRPKNH